MIILVVGSTGAGKTTYAKQLASDLSAIVYSIDNWMKNLYGQDMPADPSPSWFYENEKWYLERIERCEEQIKALALARAQIQQKSILDLGFSTKDHRKKFIEYFKKAKLTTEIHYLNVPPEERKKRVEQRNRERGETFVMTVDDSLFEYMESIFEPPQSDEGVTIKRVT